MNSETQEMMFLRLFLLEQNKENKMHKNLVKIKK